MLALYLAEARFKPTPADGEDLNTRFTFTPLTFSHFIKDCFPYRCGVGKCRCTAKSKSQFKNQNKTKQKKVDCPDDSQ